MVDAQFANQVHRSSSLEHARDDTGDTGKRQSATANREVDPLGAAELRVEAIRAIADLSERSQKIIL